MQYDLSDLATGDLTEIWDYIAQDSVTAADRLLDKLYAEFESLSDFPGVGRSRNELSEGLRSYPVGNYVIYYRRRTDSVVLIERVLHGARDVRKSLFPADGV